MEEAIYELCKHLMNSIEMLRDRLKVADERIERLENDGRGHEDRELENS
jgi:hypothetical protein